MYLFYLCLPHVRKDIWYLSLCFAYFTLHDVLQFHPLSCNERFHFFLNSWIIFLYYIYMYTTFFIHLMIYILIDSVFWLLFALNVVELVWLWYSQFLSVGICPILGLMGQMTVPFLFLKTLPYCFPQRLTDWHSHEQILHTFANICCSLLPYMAILTGVIVLFLTYMLLP